VSVTLLFTDIEGSTRLVQELGDAYPATLEDHRARVRAAIAETGGEEIDCRGDEFSAAFADPHSAVAAARAIQSEHGEAIRVRIGIHTGEIEVRPDGDVIGLAVNIAARVEQAADSTATLASSTVRDLLAGSGFTFTSTGTHQLKGIDGDWNLYAVT